MPNSRTEAEDDAQPRNLVLLFDGTSNQISGDRTNILRLYGALERNEHQIVFYDSGVGTLGMNRYLLSWKQKIEEFLGLALGYGLDDNVVEGYRFLMKHWRKSDRVYIFGFSRGAYTARVLAGFLRGFGMLAPEQENLLPYAYRAYKRIVLRNDDDAPQADGGAFAEIRMYERALKPQPVPVEFLGLFDTVSSVAMWRRHALRFTHLAWTKRNHMVRRVRHAVAIDERRRFFRAYLWEPGQPHHRHPILPKSVTPLPKQDFVEQWFAGTHGDVGGGWSEPRSGLDKVALEWMMDQVDQANPDNAPGLDFGKNRDKDFLKGSSTEPKKYWPPDRSGELNDSMIWFWPIFEIFPKFRSRFPFVYLPLGERRPVPSDATLHWSVVWRLRDTEYNPPNLPEGAKQKACEKADGADSDSTPDAE